MLSEPRAVASRQPADDGPRRGRARRPRTRRTWGTWPRPGGLRRTRTQGRGRLRLALPWLRARSPRTGDQGPTPPRSTKPDGRRPRAGGRGLVGRGESGSAVVDFVLVGTLVIVVVVALLQLVLGLHVRNVLTDAAGEGARRAALVGGTSAEAEARVRALVGAALAEDYVGSVSVTRTQVRGVTVVEVKVSAPLPVLGLLGPAGALTVTGHAVDESALAGKEVAR